MSEPSSTDESPEPAVPFSGSQAPVWSPPSLPVSPGQPGPVLASPVPTPTYPYASWFRRLGAFLLDVAVTTVVTASAILIVFLGVAAGVQDKVRVIDAQGREHVVGDWNWVGTPIIGVGVICTVLAVAFSIWNYWVRAGRTGYTLGKSVLGIRVVDQVTGQPLGVGRSIARYLCHSIVDGLPLYLGWLWPLWDSKRQSFADKMVHSVVILQPRQK